MHITYFNVKLLYKCINSIKQIIYNIIMISIQVSIKYVTVLVAIIHKIYLFQFYLF